MAAMNTKRSNVIQGHVDRVNYYLANSPDSAVKEREIVASLTSSLLHEAKSYRGFNYLYWLNSGADGWQEFLLSKGVSEGEIGPGHPLLAEKDRFIYGPSGDKTRIRFY